MAKNRFDCEPNGVADIMYDCGEDVMYIDNVIEEWHNEYKDIIPLQYREDLEGFYRTLKTCVHAANYIFISFASLELQKE